jgi:serine/threonine protein kinase
MTSKRPKVFTAGFDDYTVIRPIGSGGSGMVFEVKDADGQRLALKILNNSSATKSKLKRFRNEIQFCLRPPSDHIVRVLDFGKSEEGLLFYVMPYFSSTLRDRIKSGIQPREVLPLYNQILDGIEAAHLLGACHRDIKPENLLYDLHKNIIVLADFGIARFKEEDLQTTVDTGPNERLANFAYAAPEQRLPGKVVDERVDMYALGLILNEMFTHQIPQGTGFRQIKDVAPEFGYLDGLVELMVRQQPEDRPGQVSDVKNELIARGNEFVRWQRLEALKTEIVPQSEINDPLITDPIRAVEKEDYVNGILTLRLNRPVTKKWEHYFRRRATSFSANVSSAIISFNGDKVFVRTNDHFLQQGVDFFKQYCILANEEYAAEVVREHRQELERRRSALKRMIQDNEARSKVLERIHV